MLNAFLNLFAKIEIKKKMKSWKNEKLEKKKERIEKAILFYIIRHLYKTNQC